MKSSAEPEGSPHEAGSVPNVRFGSRSAELILSPSFDNVGCFCLCKPVMRRFLAMVSGVLVKGTDDPAVGPHDVPAANLLLTIGG